MIGGGSQGVEGSSAGTMAATSSANAAQPPHAPLKISSTQPSSRPSGPVVPSNPDLSDSDEDDADEDTSGENASVLHPVWATKKEEPQSPSTSHKATARHKVGLPLAASTSQLQSDTAATSSSREQSRLRAVGSAASFVSTNPAAAQIFREAQLQTRISTEMAAKRAEKEREEAMRKQREKEEAIAEAKRREHEAKSKEVAKRNAMQLRKLQDKEKRAVSFLI